MFQSTFPRGERRQDSGSSTGVENVSIHVPTRGTTFVICVFFVDVVVSIHVPTRGTTIAFIMSVAGLLVSIHVPTRGTTVCRAILLIT